MNPRESVLPRPMAMGLAATEYGRCAEMFRSLSPAQWAMPTGCPASDVRQMAAHMGRRGRVGRPARQGLRADADRAGRRTWQAGANGPNWTLDAVDFCRAVSRRPASITLDELLNAEVPY